MIPIYGVEKYVARCLRSVLEQDYSRLRIVLVDDASPDASMTIAEEILETENVRGHEVVIYRRLQNGGLGAVRCDMYERMFGEYTLFVDSDDYWNDTQVVSDWVAVAERGGCDVVLAHFYRDYGKHRTEIAVAHTKSGREFALGILLGTQEAYYWNKLFRTEKLLPYGMLHREGRNLWEDFCVMVPFFYEAVEHIGYLPRPVYHYVLYNQGALTQLVNPKYISTARDLLSTIEHRLALPLAQNELLSEALRIAYVRLKERLFRRMPLKYYGEIREIASESGRAPKKMPWSARRKFFYKLASSTATASLAYAFYWFSRRLRR